VTRPTGEEALSGLDCKERVRQRTLDQRERNVVALPTQEGEVR